MFRDYHNWFSPALGRPMELLVFGHRGRPVIVFPTSGGRFFEFEDRGMVAALADRIEAGHARLFCVDSIDAQSWYNRHIHPSQRVLRQLAYERYLLDELIPLAADAGALDGLATLGCSLGGYQAVNLALRHPALIRGFLSLSGIFDMSSFLEGFYDPQCYFNQPTHFLPNLTDPAFLDPMRAALYTLATGLDDQCLEQNRALHQILTNKAIAHGFHVSDCAHSHDWPAWRQMLTRYFFPTIGDPILT